MDMMSFVVGLHAIRHLIIGVTFFGLCGGFNAAAADGKGDTPLPKAEVVLEQFIKALGGNGVFEKIQSQHTHGNVDMAGQGISGKLEVFAKRPDKLLIKITMPGIGDLYQGFDGNVGWSLNPVTGPMILEGKMLDQVREQARFDAILHDLSEYKKVETVGRTPFEGQDAYQLKLVRKSGQETTEFYDIKTGLLIGSNEVQETPLGAVNVSASIGEYKKFGDALFATKLAQKMGPLTQVMTFTSMDFKELDDSVFDLPNQIKALLKK